MWSLFAIALISLWLALLSTTTLADVYKYVDERGHVYLTDEPKHRGYKLIMRNGAFVQKGKGYSASRKRYGALIRDVAEQYRLSPALLHAVISVESAYNPRALSNKGAAGLMQLMPATARRYGVDDRWDPESNLRGGAHYLRDLLNLFDQDLQLTLAAYNAGEGAVMRYGKRIPPYPETRRYVTKVMGRYRKERGYH